MTSQHSRRFLSRRDSNRRFAAAPAMVAAVVMCLWPIWSVPCCCVAATPAEMAAGAEVAVAAGAESCVLPECCRNRAKLAKQNANGSNATGSNANGADAAQNTSTLTSTASQCLCEHGECPSSERLSYLESWFASPANVHSESAPTGEFGFSIATIDVADIDFRRITKSDVRTVSRTTPLGDYPPSERRAVLCCWRN